MNLHEYQGKELLKSYGVKIQEGILAHTPAEAKAAAEQIKTLYNSGWCVVKAQVHAGGRGKAAASSSQKAPKKQNKKQPLYLVCTSSRRKLLPKAN